MLSTRFICDKHLPVSVFVRGEYRAGCAAQYTTSERMDRLPTYRLFVTKVLGAFKP